MASSCEGESDIRTQVLIFQKYHGSDLGSLKQESGMIRGMIRNPIFGIPEALLLAPLFFHSQPTMAAMARPAGLPACLLDHF